MTRTATPPLPELTGARSSAAPSLQALRPVFSLSSWESALMLTVAATTLYVVHGWAAKGVTFPLWAALGLGGVLAVSSLCALRFVSGAATASTATTRGVSRIGYATLAFPVIEGAYGLLLSIAQLWVKAPLPLWISQMAELLAILLPTAHFLVSVVASVRGLRRREERGDCAMFPLFVAWMGWFVFLLFHAGNDWSR